MRVLFRSGHGKEPLLVAVSIEPPRLDLHLGSVAVAQTAFDCLKVHDGMPSDLDERIAA
jgi:hypothetical protein